MADYTEIDTTVSDKSTDFEEFKNEFYNAIKSGKQFSILSQYDKNQKIVYDSDKEIKEEKLSDPSVLIGKTLEEARVIYKDVRVVVKDGKNLFVTSDARTCRLNVETNNDLITRIDGYY